MKVCCQRALFLTIWISVATLLIAEPVAAASSSEARVTRIVRDVKLLPAKAAPEPAELNDKVSEGTGVRTGNNSRSELTFVDLTIERLGANTIFSFSKAGRNVQLDSGSILLCVPKESGGARVTTTAVTAGITGTTLIMESTRAGRNKLTVLEGGARLSLNKYPSQSANVLGGQMIDVPAGATKLPPVVTVDLNQIMKNNPLITDFSPLPSRDLIANQPVQGQPVGGQPTGSGPGFIPPILGGLLGPGVGSGTRSTTVRTGGTRRSGRGQAKSRSQAGTRTSGTKTDKTGGTSTQGSNAQATTRGTPSPTPSPTPSRKRKHQS
jgi:hypothetical protein